MFTDVDQGTLSDADDSRGMEPLDVALRNYAELSPQRYLERTHDATIYDIAFDGNTFLLASETWVATDPVEPQTGQNFSLIFSRYRASFSGVGGLRLVTTDHGEFPGDATLVDMITEEIRAVRLVPPIVTVETDGHELSFTFKSFDIERHRPTQSDRK